MAADFKSHVLRRDEKGFFGIPFKRLLFAGVAGGLAYTLINIVLPTWSIPTAILVAILALIFTGLRGGIPLWQRLHFRLRGQLLLQASRNPKSLSAELVQILKLPLEGIRVDSAKVFVVTKGRFEVDLREWITFATAQERDGLVFVDSPLKGAEQ